MTQACEGAERRTEERNDCNVGAFVKTGAGEVDCVVKDLSPQGARIEVADARLLPDEFALMIPAVPGAHQKFDARVIWRLERSVGVSFNDGH